VRGGCRRNSHPGIRVCCRRGGSLKVNWPLSFFDPAVVFLDLRRRGLGHDRENDRGGAELERVGDRDDGLVLGFEVVSGGDVDLGLDGPFPGVAEFEDPVGKGLGRRCRGGIGGGCFGQARWCWAGVLGLSFFLGG